MIQEIQECFSIAPVLTHEMKLKFGEDKAEWIRYLGSYDWSKVTDKSVEKDGKSILEILLKSI
jgi:hypothetical protein